ncbi:MAG: VacJ family lipoprotein [Alphaproteobacteria bacterium]|nr:VacJ family lipoprotein [Alphaproteobacteria bacterium]
MRIAASFSGTVWCAATFILLAALSGCATPPSDPAERAVFDQNNDPLEPLNRKTLEANLFLDRILLKPATKIYIAILPDQARDAVKRALDNMKEPVVVINNMLQGEIIRAGKSAGRFVINSTAGVGGLYDVAEHLGLDKQNGDFGQTLYVWGFPDGPYLVLPLLGPSNPRDAAGMGIDAYIDPFSYLATAADLDEMQITRFVVDGIDQRARVIDVLDDLQKNSLDFYAELRSLSQQHRASELRHGEAATPSANFYDDPVKPPVTAPSSPSAPPSADKTSKNPPPKGMSFTLSATPPPAEAAVVPAPRPPLALALPQTPIDAPQAR